MLEKNASSASNPPADAPRPTIGKSTDLDILAYIVFFLVAFFGLTDMVTALVFIAVVFFFVDFPFFFSAILIASCTY